VDILFIALRGMLTGGKSFVDMEDLATAWEEWFKELIPLTGGPPSHDTFNRLFLMKIWSNRDALSRRRS